MASEAIIRRRAERALAVPLFRFLGASLADDADPSAGLSLTPAANLLNAVDALHGGVISTVLDLAAYLAVLRELSDDEEAVTHALSASYLARASDDGQLIVTGKVLRRARRVAFVASELRQGDRLLATAQVAKSIYEIEQSNG